MKHDDTYKGESPGKKIARYKLWHEWYALDKGTDGKILTLASREMGDYSVAKYFKKEDRLVSVDRCRDAVLAAKIKYPEADIRLGEAVDVFSSVPNFSGAFLDFCSPICPDVISTCTAIANAIPAGGLFGVGLLKGREHDNKTEGNSESWIAKLSNNRHGRRAKAKLYKDGVRAAGYRTHFGDGLPARHLTGEVGKVLDSSALGRAVTLMCMVEGAKRLQLLHAFCYHSRDATSNGSPMVYLLFRVLRTPSLGTRDITNSHKFRETKISSDPDDVRRLAIELDGDVALALNLPAGTIAAWRAHNTRGTYRSSTDNQPACE